MYRIFTCGKYDRPPFCIWCCNIIHPSIHHMDMDCVLLQPNNASNDSVEMYSSINIQFIDLNNIPNIFLLILELSNLEIPS